jgi:hypothetical protein
VDFSSYSAKEFSLVKKVKERKKKIEEEKQKKRKKRKRGGKEVNEKRG